jgi:hypothetical protein
MSSNSNVSATAPPLALPAAPPPAAPAPAPVLVPFPVSDSLVPYFFHFLIVDHRLAVASFGGMSMVPSNMALSPFVPGLMM